MPPGHLRLPNELVEALAGLRLNGSQWQILWAVWRQTLCWQKGGGWRNREWPIGISDLVDATGLNKSNVKRELSELVKYNIIFRDRSSDGLKPYPGGRKNKPMTSFNLDPAAWIMPTKGSKKETLSDEPKGSEEETLSTAKGIRSDPQRVAEKRPFTNKSDTLSQPTPKLGKKHLKKHKETEELKKPSSEATGLSQFLRTLILRNNPKAKTPADLNKWAIDIDKMINIDHRTPEEIKLIIEFSQNDSFWCANILSAGKLRDKFDQLYLKAKEKEKSSAEKKEKGGGSHAGREQQPGRGSGAHRGDPGEGDRFSGFHAIESGPDQSDDREED